MLNMKSQMNCNIWASCNTFQWHCGHEATFVYWLSIDKYAVIYRTTCQSDKPANHSSSSTHSTSVMLAAIHQFCYKRQNSQQLHAFSVDIPTSKNTVVMLNLQLLVTTFHLTASSWFSPFLPITDCLTQNLFVPLRSIMTVCHAVLFVGHFRCLAETTLSTASCHLASSLVTTHCRVAT